MRPQPTPVMSSFTSFCRLARLASAGVVAFATSVLFAGTATVSVDFTTVVRPVDPLTFSAIESGYGSTKLPNDTDQQTEIAVLDIAMLRVNLGYQTPGNPNSTIVSKVAGGDQSITGTQWVNAIKATGAIPQIRVQMDAALPQSTWVTDAANMVTYFNLTTNNRVDRWVIGNEPSDNGHTVESYAQGYVAMAAAMKAVDPTIKIGGPASAQYNASTSGFLKASLTRIQQLGGTPDFAIFHSYGSGNANNATLLAETVQKYETNPADFRQFLINTWGSTVGGAMPIEIGEWNLKTSSDARQLQHYATVWTALALGRMVSSGVISRFYADKNGLTMGFLVDTANPTYGGSSYTGQPNDPMPAYHGMGMFTGEGLFAGFGTDLVSTNTTSTTGLVYAVASDGPKNIVAINSSPTDTTTTTFDLDGVTNGSVAVWQKNSGNQSPVSLGTANVSGGSFNYTLNPYTVTTFLVTPTNPPPPVPTGLAATPGNAQVALTWNASSGATSYNVKRSTTSGGSYTTVGTPSTNSFTNTSLTNGTTYYYVVSAVNGNGESANSTQVSATPTGGGGGGTTVIEGESLTVAASSGDTWRTSSDTNGSGGAIAFFDATAANDYVTLNVSIPAAATYNVKVRYKSGNNRGIFQLASAPGVGGTYTNIGTAKDEYNASQLYNQIADCGNHTFAAGAQVLRFTVTGKNAASSGYGLAIDSIELTDQGGGGGTVAAPSFSPAAGTYSSAQSVTITTATSGATIRYTVDGSTPTSTTGTVYSSPVSISATTTLKAIAYKSGMTNSSVTTGTYTINATPITIENGSLAAGNSSNPPSNPWRTVTDGNASGGSLAFFDAVAVGNYVTRITPSVPAGTYQVSVIYKSGDTRGTYQLATAATLGGTYTNVGSPQDQYAASQVYQVEQVVGNVTFSTTGTKAIRFTVTGKNAASSGYGLAIDAVKLTPQ